MPTYFLMSFFLVTILAYSTFIFQVSTEIKLNMFFMQFNKQFENSLILLSFISRHIIHFAQSYFIGFKQDLCLCNQGSVANDIHFTFSYCNTNLLQHKFFIMLKAKIIVTSIKRNFFQLNRITGYITLWERFCSVIISSEPQKWIYCTVRGFNKHTRAMSLMLYAVQI